SVLHGAGKCMLKSRESASRAALPVEMGGPDIPLAASCRALQSRCMATFGYIARDMAGAKVTGKLTAATEQAVYAELQSRQLAPVQVRAVREQTHLKRRVSTRQLATAYRQLADL